MPTRPPLNGLSGALQSRESWDRQQALEFIRHTVARALASLTPSQQRDYVRLQREAHAALAVVEIQNAAIISEFKTRGLAQLRSKLGGQDPEQIKLHTRYLEVIEPALPWEPAFGKAEVNLLQNRFRRAYDESRYRPHLSTMSLWDAACLNFDFATGTPQQSGHSFVDASYLTGAKDLSVAQFIAISRDLDLGEQLQATLQTALKKDGRLERALQTSTKACLLFEALEAYRNRASTGVTLRLYEQLTQAIDGSGPALTFETLGMSTGVTVLPAVPFVPSGATIPVPLLLIRVASLGVLSYFPFRPGGALRYHDDAGSAAGHFAQQLKDSHRAFDLGWFARQLPMNEMHAFKGLTIPQSPPEGLSPVAGWLYDTFHRWFPEQALDGLRFTPDIEHGRKHTLVQALTYREVQRYQANLSTLATRRSERDLQAVIDGAAHLFDEVLQLLLTPMPGGVTGLNRVMQAAVFGSLTYSVIVGVNEAARGEASQFAGALADVMDMAVNGLLISTAGRVHRQRIEGLLRRLGSPRKVTGGDGNAMLWMPDIGPDAALDQNLLNGKTANAQGVYAINGKQYARVKHGEAQRVMEISYDAKAMRFTLKPENPAHFAPPIVFDPSLQAWVLDVNGTHTLSDSQLVERMLPDGSASVPMSDIEQMLRSVAASRAALDAIWAGKTAPLHVTEGVRRLQADQVIKQITRDFHRRGHMPPYAEEAVLSLLTQLPGWPVEAQLQVHDQHGQRLQTYAGRQPPASGAHTIKLKRRDDGTYVGLDDPAATVVSQESLFEAILRQLPTGSILGKEGSPNLSEAQRIARLRLQISQRAQADQLALFSALTRYAEHTRDQVSANDDARYFVPFHHAAPRVEVTPLLEKLRTLYAPLTPAHLEYLLERTPLNMTQQASFLNDASLPAVVKDNLEHHRMALRIDEVIDGLYHPRAFNPDTDSWAREFAASLLRIRFNRDFVVTEMADEKAIKPYISSGPDDTTVNVLHHGQGGYEANDLHNAGPIPVSPASDSFYLAIGSVLQPHERVALGMHSPIDAQGLRNTLANAMSAQRSPEGYISLLDRSLGQYAMSVVLPFDEPPNATGVYELNGQTLLPLMGSVYSIIFDTKRLKWRLKHPQKIGVDTPLLEHNRRGAWRLANDNPMAWNDHQLFSRLGNHNFNVDQTTASRILSLTDTPARALREVHSTHLPPPPLLSDTSKRFRIEREILAFIQAMATYSGTDTARPSLQLLLVTSLPGWPDTHALVIVDSQGGVRSQYPSKSRLDAEKIRISEAQSRGAEPLGPIARNDTVTSALLGELPTSQQERLSKLAKKISEYAYRERAQLFNTLYLQSEPHGTALEQRFKTHHPALPHSAVTAILEQASPKELKQLQTHDRVGLRLAEQARLTVNDTRLNRAFEGLYLNTLANPDSEKITLHLLKSLPGWPATLRLDIHEGSDKGRLLESAGHLDGSERRILARLGGGYQAYDSQGRLLNEPADAPHDLLRSIVQLLSTEQRKALEVVDGLDITPLQQRIAELALNQRVAIKTLLGLPHIPPWLQPPMRVDSSFLAYPFTLRNLWPSSADQPPTADLVSKLRELYPSLSAGVANYMLQTLGSSDPARLIELERRRAEYQALDYGLTQWAEAPHANDADDPLGLNLGRRRYIAQHIRSAWRMETRRPRPGSMYDMHFLELQLDGNDLPDPDFILGTRGFEHIDLLKISGEAFPPTGNAFIGKFSNLSHLHVDCRLTELPASITDMHTLRYLDLAENDIVLTPESRERLAGMTQLVRLYLDDNPLGLTPDVSAMTELIKLDLRGTGIDQWPIGAESLFGLQSLRLEENRITTIPDAVFTDVRMEPANGHTFLHDNPLTTETLTRITRYREQTGILLGGALPGITHAPVSSADAGQWLAGVPDAQHGARKQLWEQLQQNEGASPDDAFRVLADLSQSYAYTHSPSSRQTLTDRVWRLLDAMGESTELRDTVFHNTYAAGTCGDGAILTFIDMEILHKLHQAKARPNSKEADRELLALAKGLFYLRHVDYHAQRRIESLYESGLDPDDAEVKLYYRLKLRTEFNLPVQHEEMLYSVQGWVSERDIGNVRTALIELSRTEAQQTALLMEEFWIDYLARSLPEPFQTIDAIAGYQIIELNQQVADKRSDGYLEKRQNIIDQKTAELARLVKQLTQAAQIGQRAD
ncbi:NEL-type E3 ubiquitin ligase domain-containing protein [Pseudomonas costantinii]|uniref:RING-type E3 ubiquitin transferase n=1 Tax=Pseudomonas costantinii TaxID=168469 RepID=A0A1S2UD08_9PSED|nr:NEL-type E3 ubiquitin ligase domain-containing protein [Pseudomonas costantinii]NVZ18267.1 hypothetical protein [Pseudomonas costantinii]OIN43956.1 hypothetical protein BFL40_31365 [Pseudomonas costantinii]SEE24559.1 C-terminal novel E3 ligase, LRR-interacting [Pseudomonas costantinii]